MKIKNNYIVSVLMCAVLFLASCTEDEMADGTHLQKQDLRTVSVNFNMPGDKPSFGEDIDSRALDADADSIPTIHLEFAEQGKSRATSFDWEANDEILVEISAGSTQARLTLYYTIPSAEEAISEGESEPTGYWTLAKNHSYVKYSSDDTFVYYNAAVAPLFVEDNEESEMIIDLNQPLTMRVDETVTAPVTVTLIYAPQMDWNFEDGCVSLTSTAGGTLEKWTATGTEDWTTEQARLRVNTGAEGDVVTLTSLAFDSEWKTEPADGIYTATTDAQGNAYFYGATTGELTDNFIVKLTQMRVSVPPAPRASEGRSVALDDAKQNVIITLDTPITLLEASDVVPVTLTATKAYRIEADVKRTASAKANLSVIDGSCGITERQNVEELGSYFIGTANHLPLVLKQIETAVAMGITKFTVVNELALYQSDPDSDIYSTIVGEAIRQFGSNNGDTKISLTLADATVVFNGAFYGCTALKSVSAPKATLILLAPFIDCTALEEVELGAAVVINNEAFKNCTALERVSAPYLKEIYNFAFEGCESLASVTMDEVTHIYSKAFKYCTALTTVNLNKVIYIGEYAFSGLQLTDLEIGKNAASDEHISLDPMAFSDCTLTGSVKFHKVVGYGSDVVDGLTQKNAFDGVATSELDLFLHAEQPIAQISVSNDGKLKWAGAVWKSITIGNVPLTVVGNEIYAVIDGTCEDVDKVKVQIQNAPGNAEGKKNILVIDGLAQYSNSGSAGTVVGEAIRICGAADGSISLVLDDPITAILTGAFTNCKALNSVVAKKVATIGVGAFNECTKITAITFGTIIESCLESAFGQVNSEVQPWTMSCDLTLAQGQNTSQELPVNWNFSHWASYDWKTITVGTQRFYPL